MQRSRIGKVDFHIHSYASNVTDYYAANTFAIPESYSDPIENWHALKSKGMDLVTLTDHNSIDGVLEMLHKGLPDVFISAEMTTTFPEDGCNIHVTVANMTEAQFREVDRLRGNVYEMVDYVDQEIAVEKPGSNKLAYFMTHPLMSTQNRPYGREGALGVDHLEKALLLFNMLEGRNGTRTKHLNELTMKLLGSLTPELIERLANKHGIAPKGEAPWLKTVLGGSDDHSGINPGETWTRFQYAGSNATPNDLIEAMRRRETVPEGAFGGPVTLAHAVFKLLHDGQKQTVSPTSKGVRLSGPIELLLKFAFGGDELTLREKLGFKLRNAVSAAKRITSSKRRKSDVSFEQILAQEAEALIADPRTQATLKSAACTDDKIFFIISELLNRVFAHYVERIRGRGELDLIRTIKELVALVTSNIFVSLPYFLSCVSQSSDKLIARDVRKRFEIEGQENLLLVTDTLFDVNGVAKTIWKMIAEAERRDLNFVVATCLSAEEKAERMRDPKVARLVASGQLKIFTSVVSLDFPEYKDLKVAFPPLLEFLKWAQECGFTKMQISTPGTVGLAGLAAAKLLQIDSSATYHTSFPEYVENYTQDLSLEAFTWKYMILFYHSVDEVVVPSQFIARLLRDRGLRKRKLMILDRWVDTARFRPEARTRGFWKRFGLEREDSFVKFLYVGRLGVEKNLDVLVDAYRRLHAENPRAHLIVVGDGPYRAKLEEMTQDLPVTFTGFLGGEDLVQAIASADAKVFPSTTDTWGNAPLEAQACGLPVVVTDRGGPQELMVDGETGFCVRGRETGAIYEAMEALMDDATRARMGAEARAFTLENRIDEPFSAILESLSFRRRAEEAKRTAKAAEGQDRKAPRQQTYIVEMPPLDLEDAQTSITSLSAAGEIG